MLIIIIIIIIIITWELGRLNKEVNIFKRQRNIVGGLLLVFTA